MHVSHDAVAIFDLFIVVNCAIAVGIVTIPYTIIQALLRVCKNQSDKKDRMLTPFGKWRFFYIVRSDLVDRLKQRFRNLMYIVY